VACSDEGNDAAGCLQDLLVRDLSNLLHIWGWRWCGRKNRPTGEPAGLFCLAGATGITPAFYIGITLLM